MDDTTLAKLIELSRLQAEMHRRLTAKMADPPTSLGTLASHLGVNWGELKRFVDDGQPLCSPRLVGAVTDYLKWSEGGQRIIQVADGLSDKQRGLASFDAATLRLVAEILQAHEPFRDELTFAEFGSLFGRQAEAVTGVLNLSKEGIRNVTSPEASGEIRKILRQSSRMAQQVGQIRQERLERRLAKARELDPLLKQLRPRYQNLGELGKALGTSASTLHYIARGKASDETIDQVLAAARRLQAKSISAESRATRGDRDRPNQTDAQPTVDTIVAKHSGGESPLGTPSTLTAASFQLIDPKLVNARILTTIVEQVVISVRLSRGLINTVTMMDAASREKADEILGSELAELELSLRGYAAANPGRLAEFLDLQRSDWLNKLKGGS